MEENNKIIIYTNESGLTKLDVRLENETLWLTQAQMRELYQTRKSNVSEHIKHIFEDGELQEDAVVRKFRTTAADGKAYLTSFYNLDTIIALSYRMRSIIATRFRQWATQRLREILNWNVPPATSRLSAKATMWCMVSQKTIKRCMIRWWSRALSPQSSDHWEHKALKSPGAETCSEGLSVAKTFQEQRCRQRNVLTLACGLMWHSAFIV